VNSSGSLPGSTSMASSVPSNPFLARGSKFSEQDLNMELSLLAQAANRANVTFYAVDPRGLTSAMANLGNNFSDVAEWRNYLKNTQDSLRTLTELTGGFAITNTNSFEAGLARIDNETSNYYMLGYTSSNLDPLKKDRRIIVKVTRPGAVVTSWRQGYRLQPLSVIK
jgi:VWFA-related protein